MPTKNNSLNRNPFEGSNKSLILVIDDNIVLLELIHSILEASDYRSLIAENIKTGIEIYKNNFSEIKLIILDMTLRETDYNYNIPALVKINPKVKILAISGLTTLENLPENLRANVLGLLPKPFSISQLLIKMQKILKSEN